MAARKGSIPWNKGTAKGFIDNRGYRSFKIGKKTIREHRLVMEKHLGRKLEPWEHIHHIDENKLNNSIDNLQIISAQDHAKEHSGGQRSDQSKISMALMRTMRMEIVELRKLNSEMLEALEHIYKQYKYELGETELNQIESAIKKAKGEL